MMQVVGIRLLLWRNQRANIRRLDWQALIRCTSLQKPSVLSRAMPSALHDAIDRYSGVGGRVDATM